ncbi:MAG: cytochrome c1 [Alphaproteobacteria bacterium]|mgnify:FL=1|nr:cytochrome c1 [Alphaproteobacteria bacterium]MDP6590660.1 cytochrome c1 [Alphaproteobacteria bacterium]MDP6819350.1 cytochrome c1 [Alphaproteobacteria bacterium]|tara:strand:- start:67 stop:837 length:771 start_codon:yes stop_codon:yes gene_type:complete
MRAYMLAIAATLGLTLAGLGTAHASGDTPDLPDHDWNHTGIFSTFDRAELQRGFQVFQEVCASCHSLDFIAFRNLTEIGFNADQVKAIAAEYEVEDGPDDEGEMFMRAARASDYFPAPFANPQAARAANSGAFPPDLSVIVKARDFGLDYLYALLTGYEEEPPEGVELADGMSYNHFFPGQQIAMPEPLYEEAVEYADGTAPTLEQLSHDVSVFLAWTAEPEMEIRKKTGLKVLIFIAIFTALIYIIKRRVWAKLH